VGRGKKEGETEQKTGKEEGEKEIKEVDREERVVEAEEEEDDVSTEEIRKKSQRDFRTNIRVPPYPVREFILPDDPRESFSEFRIPKKRLWKFWRMIHAGFSPDQEILFKLLRAHCRKGLFETSESFYRRLRESPIFSEFPEIYVEIIEM
jgi:hypothetical protein